jgi:hypothetical protein
MVNNAAEQAALQKGIASVGGGNFWTDGYRYQSRWYWTNWRKLLTFTNWGNGQPNNYKGNQNYIRLYTNDGTWDDAAGTTKIGFICEEIVPSCS